ncbi:MAG: PSD1 and planctomycete cytochrome C domain-containing protein [Planctomycetaceae bacterium]
MRFLCVLVGLIISPPLLADDPANVEFFEKQVRPLLVAKCQECHGADTQEGELRLDSKNGWQKGGTRGVAIVPGKPDESLLMKAISYVDTELKMPPETPLAANEIALLKEWITRGAIDPRIGEVTISAADKQWEEAFNERLGWWSLQPLAEVTPPVVADPLWSREPVDRFVRASLDSAELSPASPAEPQVLLRRLAFVLTGLPPTPELREKFLQRWQQDPQSAYEQLADDLLASPHFGERFARHWMDVVRYTDTYGYESDNPANGAYEYRDYLIRAFNGDLPYDQFVREQVAGDLIAEPRINSELGLNENAIAPMFYHLGEHREGGSLMFNGIHQQMVDNKIDAFSKAFLATTVACARCHDHKLEAVSQRDYYQLAAVFMTPRWTSRVIDAPGKNDAAIARLKELRVEIRREMATVWLSESMKSDFLSAEALRATMDDKEAAELKIDDVAYPLAKLLMADADVDVAAVWNALAAEWTETRDKRIAANAEYQILADFQQPQIPAGWVMEGDGMTHGYVDEGTPLVSLEGEDVIARVLPRGYHTNALSSKLPGALRSPALHDVPGQFMSLQLAGGEYGGYLYVQGNGFKSEKIGFFKSPVPAWQSFSDETLINGVPNVTVEFATTALNPNFPPRIGLSDGLPHNDPGYDKRSWLSITGIVTHDKGGLPQGTLDQFASLFEGEAPASSADAAARLKAWLIGAIQRWCHEELRPGDELILNWLLSKKLLPNRASADSRLASLLDDYRRVEQSIPFPRTVTGMDERELHEVSYPINIRGDVDVIGEMVTPDFLRMFDGRHSVAASHGSGRLELAEFLVEADHPLTARVYVNRLWYWLFGTGLVSTPDDFGHLGDKPSHPELLDYLAREFVREGWSTKTLIRRIVLSETFRQTGSVTDAGRQRDPSNRLWHHYPTRRLEAEAIRDSLLAVSGRLDPALYGRPIDPPRTAEATTNKRLLSGPLDGHGRRSLYLYLSIMEPPKFLVGFNLPDLKLPTGKRDVTNVPSQALTMLNDPFVIAMSAFWAKQLISQAHASPEDCLMTMFIRAFGREPSDGELQRWSAALRDLATEGHAEIMTDEAAWTRMAHAVFNAKEFIYYR